MDEREEEKKPKEEQGESMWEGEEDERVRVHERKTNARHISIVCFFSSQFEVCKCITLVSRPRVCDCNAIGQVGSCLYQRNGEEEEHMKQ